MNAPYYSAEDIQKLKKACEEDCSAYSSQDDLTKLLEDMLIKTRLSSYVFNNPPPLLDGSSPAKDVDDAIALHEWLTKATPKIPRSVFGDERLWTALCHVTFADYMIKRWGTEKSDDALLFEEQTDNREKTEGYGRISIRFFVKGASQRGIVRNGLARLFWAADLAFESGSYELVHQMFRKQDIHQNIIERSMCIDPEITKSMLKEFAQLDKAELSKTKIQLVAKLVNGAGGTRTLETVSKSDMKDSFELAFPPITVHVARDGKIIYEAINIKILNDHIASKAIKLTDFIYYSDSTEWITVSDYLKLL
jgi:hypothetical protein